MTTVTYSVKDLSTGTIYTNPEQTIIITAYPSAKETTVSICWGGITTTYEGACWHCSDESSHCESVYIGENTDCTNTKKHSGTFTWHGFTITYEITQAKNTDCPDCGSPTTYCDIIDYYVDPYYVNYNTTSVTVYYNYWETKEDNCGITRERKKASTSVSISPSTITCDATNRELDVSFTDACGVSHTAKCYVQKPDICCSDPNKVCYVINDMYYSPSIVPSSGANVSYYFDYKKIETVDCVEKITFGRYEGTWKIKACDDPQDTAPQRCCRDHIEREKLSKLTTDWDGEDKKLCNGGNVKDVELSIIQTKNPTYSGDCSNICEQDVGYCVSSSTITTYYKDANDEWIPWGQYVGGGSCSITATPSSLNCSGNVQFGLSDGEGESSWRWLDQNYEMPYFGGSMRVTWKYSAYTVYDDCTTGMTSGNEWEDILDILPYEGECYDEAKNQCGIISVANEDANRCDGGTTRFSFSPNGSAEPDFVVFSIDYVFKKAPCELTDKNKFPETVAALCDCNKFTVRYKQKKTSCGDDCGSCVNNTAGHSLPSGATTVTDTFDTSCSIRLIDKPYWVTSVSIDSSRGNITYDIQENTSSNREGGVTFQLNGKDCYDTVILSQVGSGGVDPHDEDPDVECDCDAMFDVFSLTRALPASGGRSKIGTYIFDDCIDESSISIGGGDVCTITSSTSSLNCSGTVQFGYTTSHSSGVKPDWINNIDFEGGYIYGDVDPNDSNPPQERTGNLSVAHMVDGAPCETKEIEIKQGVGGCTVTLDVSGDRCPGTDLIITPNF